MFKDYFQQELSNLREIARAYGEANPAIAPMLAEPSPDPDVERILESVAFLTGMIRERIDDEFPEIIHDLLNQVWPHYLRPLPSMTMIEFKSAMEAGEEHVPAGSFIQTTEINKTKCKFQITEDVDVLPIEISEAKFHESSGKKPFIKLDFKLNGTSLDQLNITNLRFYLGGSFKEAADIYYVLFKKLEKIRVKSEGHEFLLNKDQIKPAGFSEKDALIPYPENAFKGYRLFQEYLYIPEKFLFFDITDLDDLKDFQDFENFSIEFELSSDPDFYFKPDKDNFKLFVSPGINLFDLSAVPVNIDHKSSEYKIIPDSKPYENFHVYSIESATGHFTGVAEVKAFESFNGLTSTNNKYIYKEKLKRASIGEKIEKSFSLNYSPGGENSDLNLITFELKCTNGNLPSYIGVNADFLPTWSTPARVSYTNLIKPTETIIPPVGGKSLWNLITLLNLNSSSLLDAENLKTLLNIYLIKDGNQNRKKIFANEKRIQGIKSLETRSTDRLVNGIMMRGLEIELRISQEHFAGIGDIYLFGMILDNFFGQYVTINTFTKLKIEETDTGEIFTWPERIGNKNLI